MTWHNEIGDPHSKRILKRYIPCRPRMKGVMRPLQEYLDLIERILKKEFEAAWHEPLMTVLSNR
jgi:hypothetical protein